MIAAARGYGVSMGDLLMVAEDVAQGRLSLPWPTAVASGEIITWCGRKPARGERLRRLSGVSSKRGPGDGIAAVTRLELKGLSRLNAGNCVIPL